MPAYQTHNVCPGACPHRRDEIINLSYSTPTIVTIPPGHRVRINGILHDVPVGTSEVQAKFNHTARTEYLRGPRR